MDSPAFVPAKDAVESLIRRFVSPLLPRLKISRPPPTVEQQQKVGKQMHAVVILYNYFQRKESPKSEYLNFKSFCETACILFPSLMDYMKFICKGAGSSDDPHEQLSIAEKFVMNACDICTTLNASTDFNNINKWAISKIAVFLVDAAKKKCLLNNGSVILGSWSIVEKDLEEPLEKSACCSERNCDFKKGTANESEKCRGIEDFLQQIAYSAVEQEMGITFSNLNILEYHLTYSLSQLNSSTRLYIMSYEVPGSSAVEVSIEDVTSLSGAPVKRNSCDMKPEITSLAEHYCLLPYIGIVAEWAIRKTSQCNSPHLLRNNAAFKYSDSPLVTANGQIGVQSEAAKGPGRGMPDMKKVKLESKINGSSKESFQQRTGSSSLPVHNRNPIPNGSKSRSFISNKVIPEGERTHKKDDLCLFIDCSKDQAENSVENQSPGISDGNTLNTRQIGFTNHSKPEASALQLFPEHNKSNDYASRFLALASNKDDLEAVVFQFLKNKRDELSCQHRSLEDFIAHCEKNIQTMISEENQVSHPKAMMKAYDFLLSSKFNRDTDFQLQPHNISKKLIDADLLLRSPCQELDEICRRNHWILPKYIVFPSPDNEKFTSIITVNGLDFKYMLRGDSKDGPEQARESAAASMLTKLQEMATQARDC